MGNIVNYDSKSDKHYEPLNKSTGQNHNSTKNSYIDEDYGKKLFKKQFQKIHISNIRSLLILILTF